MVKLQPTLHTAATVLILLLLGALFVLRGLRTSLPGASSFSSTRASAAAGWADAAASSASQGKLWQPVVWRQYEGARRNVSEQTISQRQPTGLECTRWAVVTTIFAPTTLLKQLRELQGWCLVVVGDRRTDDAPWRTFEQNGNATVYISADDQTALGYSSLEHLPWDHFGRKNVGYLYAVHHGATQIWDTDDDNVLIDPEGLTRLADFADSKEKMDVPLAAGEHHLFNPYPRFRPVRARTARPEGVCWPRGFPLEYVKDTSTAGEEVRGRVSTDAVGVYQSLANNDPDVDAIYRLTKELPLSFLQSAGKETGQKLALSSGRVASFNAQATLWMRKSFWGMLLPVSVHGRVSDIWRSYFVQCIMRDLGQHVAFTAPLVVQYRNVHSLIADLQSEVPLYTQADALTKWLRAWKPKDGNSGVAERTEQLFINLYEIGVLEEEDVRLVQAWLDDLIEVGYEIPGVTGSRENIPEDAIPKDPHVENRPKTAMCVSGQVRSLNLKLDDELHPGHWFQQQSTLPNPNMTVAESIQRHLYPKLGQVDVFMTVATRETGREPKVGDLSVCEPLRPSNGLLECEVPKEQYIPIERQDVVWTNFTLAKYGAGERVIQGFLQQLKGMFDCYAMVRQHSLKTGKEYDWIVRMRPDNYMVSFPGLERLALDATRPTVWHGNEQECCCGQEDRFGIAPARWMEEYFTRFLYVQQLDWYCTERNCSNWNAEKFLLEHLKSYGIDLRPHPDISLCPLKPTDRKRRSQP